MKKTLNLLTLLVLLPCSLFAQSEIPAFPGAEGFGKYTVGGRGGKVVTVTTLQDYTSDQTPIEGSLRWALNQYVSTDSAYQTYASKVDGSDSLVQKPITVYEPLTIVFNVAGNIQLLEDLKVKRDYLTIAGQTAPGDGICITGHSMLFNGATGGEMFHWGPRRRQLIVRYIRFRPNIPDATYVTYGTDIENYENVIFDHCTMTWANEECLAIYDTKNTTVQWCLVAEGLYSANHTKGNRSYCGVWGGQFASYHHNLVAHNAGRNIRFDGARAHDTIAVIDFRNNVVYNWGSTSSGYGLEVEIKTPETRNELNMVNNYYKQGPATSTGRTVKKSEKAHRLVIVDQDSASWNAGYHSQHYVTGNYITNFPTVTADNWNYGVQFSKVPYTNDSTLANTQFRALYYSPEVADIQPDVMETAEEAYQAVLYGVGATIPQRDMQDARIVSETFAGTASGSGKYGANKGIIDNPDTVGGWPVLSGTPYIDTDGDGIPDDWETANQLNPNLQSDGALITASGYSNLELYLNSMTPVVPEISGIQNHTATAAVICSYNRAEQELFISAENKISKITLYNITGSLLLEQTANANTLSVPLSNIPNGNYILQIGFAQGTAYTQKISLF